MTTDASRGGAALSAEERAALRALCERTTPGPWEYQPENSAIVATTVPAYEAYDEDEPPRLTVISTRGAMGGDDCIADAAFIAAARTALPRLLDALGRSERDRDAQVEAQGALCEIIRELRRERDAKQTALNYAVNAADSTIARLQTERVRQLECPHCAKAFHYLPPSTPRTGPSVRRGGVSGGSGAGETFNNEGAG